MADLAKKAKAQQFKGSSASSTQILNSLAAALVKNPKKLMLFANEDDDTPISVLVIPFDPITGLMNAVSIESATGAQVTTNSPTADGINQANNTNLNVSAWNYFFNNSASRSDRAEEASGIIAARVTGAASTNLLPAGGAGLKYKIFAMSIDVSGTAATGQVSINEATSGAILLASDIGAAGTAGNNIYCGPNGVLQPNANNAIQITSVANATVNATLVYGAAR